MFSTRVAKKRNEEGKADFPSSCILSEKNISSKIPPITFPLKYRKLATGCVLENEETCLQFFSFQRAANKQKVWVILDCFLIKTMTKRSLRRKECIGLVYPDHSWSLMKAKTGTQRKNLEAGPKAENIEKGHLPTESACFSYTSQDHLPRSWMTHINQQ
jgi:hypothetical protein